LIASVNARSEVARTVLESKAGRIVEPENARALLSEIREFRGSELKEYSRHAREYARQRWARANILGYFEESLKAVSA
jgi:hypothetical protein